MALYDDVRELIDGVVAKYKEAVADSRLSWQEGLKLMGSAVATGCRLVEKFDGFTGAEKKEAVLAALDRIFTEVVAPALDAKLPDWMEGMVTGTLKKFVLELCGAWIDSLVDVFNRVGWSFAAEVTPVARIEDVLIFNCLRSAA